MARRKTLWLLKQHPQSSISSNCSTFVLVRKNGITNSYRFTYKTANKGFFMNRLVFGLWVCFCFLNSNFANSASLHGDWSGGLPKVESGEYSTPKVKENCTSMKYSIRYLPNAVSISSEILCPNVNSQWSETWQTQGHSYLPNGNLNLERNGVVEGTLSRNKIQLSFKLKGVLRDVFLSRSQINSTSVVQYYLGVGEAIRNSKNPARIDWKFTAYNSPVYAPSARDFLRGGIESQAKSFIFERGGVNGRYCILFDGNRVFADSWNYYAPQKLNISRSEVNYIRDLMDEVYGSPILRNFTPTSKEDIRYVGKVLSPKEKHLSFYYLRRGEEISMDHPKAKELKNYIDQLCDQ